MVGYIAHKLLDKVIELTLTKAKIFNTNILKLINKVLLFLSYISI